VTVVDTLAVSALGVRLGSIVFFSFVAAPTTFDVLGDDAGRVVNAIFPKYYVFGAGLGVVAFLAVLAYPAARAIRPPAVGPGLVAVLERQVPGFERTVLPGRKIGDDELPRSPGRRVGGECSLEFEPRAVSVLPEFHLEGFAVGCEKDGADVFGSVVVNLRRRCERHLVERVDLDSFAVELVYHTEWSRLAD